jgi:alginate O-acetyltransferase complex protein AlgI
LKLSLPSRVYSLNPVFWGLLVGNVAVNLATRRWARNAHIREWVFAGTQLASLLLIADIGWKPVLFFVLPLLVAVYLLGKALALAGGARKNRVLFWVAVLIPVAALAITKYSILREATGKIVSAAGWQLAIVPVAGLSYLVFKSLHYLVDVSSGRISGPTFRSFLGFTLFLSTYPAGPMDRYDRFRKDFENPVPLTCQDAFEATWRIVVGLFKKYVLAALLARFAFSAFTTPELASASPSTIWMSVYAYALLIYLDFSGYSDLAIGSGRLLGVVVPENFRHPYLKRNIIEFWNAWHITLSNWLRDYLFMPIGKALMKRKRAGGSNLTIAAASYIATFAVAGIWHGDGLNFLLWGVYNGVGLSVCKAYGQWTRPLPPAFHRFMQETIFGKGLAVALTFHFVVAGMVLFGNDLTRAMLVFRRLAGIG